MAMASRDTQSLASSSRAVDTTTRRRLRSSEEPDLTSDDRPKKQARFSAPPSFSLSPPVVAPPARSASPLATHLSDRPSPSLSHDQTDSLHLQPSDPLPRKLLILDLNGALVYRSSSRSGGRPRPYIPTLEQYLLHQHSDVAWDVMVWSSAMPQSVSSMVRNAFSTRMREALLALWDRSHFGLAKEDYERQFDTLKDLERPWTFLRSEVGGGLHHNKATTLLLDDSTAKAALQPFNHISCLEYEAILAHKEHDRLDAHYQHQKQSKNALKKEKKKQRRKAKEEGKAVDATLSLTTKQIIVEAEHAVMLTVPTLDPPLSSPAPSSNPKDSMLIAVIGVLDALRLENDVAFWIQSGGLWGDIDGVALHTVANPHDNTEQLVDQHQYESAEAVASGDSLVGDSRQPLWFEDPIVYAFWLERGKQTLSRLDIALEPYTERQLRTMQQV